jgi:hypothetical protein
MSFIRRYVFSTDHKVIGLQYYFLALFAVSWHVCRADVVASHIPGMRIRWLKLSGQQVRLAA